MRRFVVPAFALSCLILVAACGDPAGPEDTFTFDPVPYVTPAGGPPLSWDPVTCDPYIADQVIIVAEAGAFDELKTRIELTGFTIRDEGSEFLSLPRRRQFLVGVPLGSVPDAVALMQNWNGVIDAGSNGLGPQPQEFTDKFLKCTPKPEDGGM